MRALTQDWPPAAMVIIAGSALFVLMLIFLPEKSKGQASCGNPPGSVSMGCPAPSATLTISIAPYNDGTDLGRAMAICQQHRDWYSPQSILEPILYQQEWDACRTIHDKWGRSEAAKRFREQLELEKRDKAFVETIANSGD